MKSALQFVLLPHISGSIVHDKEVLPSWYFRSQSKTTLHNTFSDLPFLASYLKPQAPNRGKRITRLTVRAIFTLRQNPCHMNSETRNPATLSAQAGENAQETRVGSVPELAVSHSQQSRNDRSGRVALRPELDGDSEEGGEDLTDDRLMLSTLSSRDHSATMKLPPRRSADEVFEISTEHLLPETDKARESSAQPTDRDDDSKKNFVLSRQKQPQSMYNYGSTKVSGNASVTLGTIANDARYDPPNIQQNFGSVQIQKGATSVFGNVNYFHTPALFGGLQALTMDGTNKTAAEYRKSRASIQVSDNLCN